MSLVDITNISDQKVVTQKKRMKDGTIKSYNYARCRKQFELSFKDNAEKVEFESKLDVFKKKHGFSIQTFLHQKLGVKPIVYSLASKHRLRAEEKMWSHCHNPL